MKLTIDPSPPIYRKPLYFDYIVEGLKYLVTSQNADGSWGKKNLSTFRKIYYTTQVVQCLLRAGFPLNSRIIQNALSYLDNYRQPDIENRAVFFLYLPLGRLSEDELRNYLELLKEVQRDDGTFMYEIRDLEKEEEEITMDEWPRVRRGIYVFYTLHALHFLSMIDEQKYKNLTSLKNEIWNPAWQWLFKELEREEVKKPRYTLRDPYTNEADPELTSYGLALLHKIGYQIPRFPEVIKWLLNKQVEGSWLYSCKATSFVIMDLCTLSFDNSLLQLVKKAVEEAMKWLVKNKEKWEKNPNLTALAISALISGNIFLNPNFQEAFFVNYTETLRKEIMEREKQIRKAKRKTKIQNTIYFILGIVIPLIIEYLIIPALFIP